MNEHRPAIGLIGYGHWGRNLARNFSALGVLRAVCEPDAARRAAAGELYGNVAFFETLDAMLDAGGLDAVAVAAPAALHSELASAALRAGLHVFVEKPLALRVEDGRALVELAAQCGKVLMVGHLLEYHPAVRILEDLVARGELGQLRYIYSNRLNWGKVRREEDILWSFAPHDIGVILRLLGERPSRVHAWGRAWLQPNVADVTLSTLEFPSGVAAHIFVSWLHPFKEQRLVVVGDRQVAVFEDTAPAGHKLRLYAHGIEWIDRYPVARRAEGTPVPLPDVEPLRAECEAFVEAVRSGQPPRTDGAWGLAVLEVLASCQRDLAAGQPAPRPVTSPDEPSAFVHPTAVVDEGAQLGHGTKVWHFSHVMGGARIGARCVLGQNVFVAGSARIGDGVKIQNNVSVYDGVILEDDVFVGPSAVFTNVRNPRAHVERKDAYEPTVVRRGATIGANATVRCGVTIGPYAFVGAGALVTRDVAAHAVVVGVPARHVAWACACGEVLDLPASAPDGTEARCPRCGEAWGVAGGRLVSRPRAAPT